MNLIFKNQIDMDQGLIYVFFVVIIVMDSTFLTQN